MKNHLIIGIGGTGGKILAAFRKNIYQEFQEVNNSELKIAYLYIDSSKSDLEMKKKEQWETLGTSVRLNENSLVNISVQNLRQYIQQQEEYLNLKSWLGKAEKWNHIIGNFRIEDGAAGQKRRLGRLLFAANVGTFKQALTLKVRDLETKQSNQKGVTFHVCCGLAGGTGSGAIIDVITQIKKEYNGSDYRIILYTLLPEEHPHPAWAKTNYHANGYAALLELNALSVGRFQPKDVASYTEEAVNIGNKNAFYACYLFSDTNENGVTINVNTEIPKVVADFLYQKIIVTRNIEIEPFARAEKAENDSLEAEKSKGKQSERSKQFMAFGIKRVSIPKEEIYEYITYNYIEQLTNKLEFNNWNDQRSYIPEARYLDYTQIIRDNLNHWKLSRKYLTLDKEIKPSTKWTGIAKDWETKMISWKKEAEKLSNHSDRLDYLITNSEKYFKQDYPSTLSQGMGVLAYYNDKKHSVDKLATQIIRLIEDDFMEKWLKSNYALREFSNIIQELIKELNREKDNIINIESASVTRIDEEQLLLKRLENEWNKLGYIAFKFTSKPNKILSHAANTLKQIYILKTYNIAYDFARNQLIHKLIQHLELLDITINRSADIIHEIMTTANEKIASRCNDKGTISSRVNDQNVKFYEPDEIKQLCTILINNRALQDKQINAILNQLEGQLGRNPRFSSFNNLEQDLIVKLLETQCANISKSDIQNPNIVESDKRIVNDNIIREMQKYFNSSPNNLKTFTKRLIESAGTFVQIDKGEINKGNSVVDMMTSFVLIYPSNENSPFVNKLTASFSSNQQTDISFDDPIQGGKENELILASIKYGFPLRCVKNMQFLKAEYDKLTQHKEEDIRSKAIFELHIQTERFPSLYRQHYDPKKDKDTAAAYLLLANILGVLQKKETAAHSNQFILEIEERNQYNIPIYTLALSEKFTDSPDAIDSVKKLKNLERIVSNKMNEEEVYKHQIAEGVKQLIGQKLKEIEKERKSTKDKTYQLFLRGSHKAFEIIDAKKYYKS